VLVVLDIWTRASQAIDAKAAQIKRYREDGVSGTEFAGLRPGFRKWEIKDRFCSKQCLPYARIWLLDEQTQSIVRTAAMTGFLERDQL
jgi:hypothetical protein